MQLNEYTTLLPRSRSPPTHLGFAKLPLAAAAVIGLEQLQAPPPGVLGQGHAPHQHLVPGEWAGHVVSGRGDEVSAGSIQL